MANVDHEIGLAVLPDDEMVTTIKEEMDDDDDDDDAEVQQQPLAAGHQQQQQNNIKSQRRNYAKISNVQRQDLVNLVVNQSFTLREAADLTGIGYPTAWAILKHFTRTGNVAAKDKGGSVSSILTEDILASIEDIISQNPELTLNEIKMILERNNPGYVISKSSVDRALTKLAITVKKRNLDHDQINADDYIRSRKDYAEWFRREFPGNDYSRCVFIGETTFNLHLRKLRIPTIRGRSLSILSSIGTSGMHLTRTFPVLSINGTFFLDYLCELCNHLRNVKHLESVCLIADHTLIHFLDQGERIAQGFEYGFKCLPPYSHMLNPIEDAFCRIINLVREKLQRNHHHLPSHQRHKRQTGVHHHNRSLGELIQDVAGGEIRPQDVEMWFDKMGENIEWCRTGMPYNNRQQQQEDAGSGNQEDDDDDDTEEDEEE